MISAREKKLKLTLTALCELFAVFTVIWLIAAGEPERLPMAVGTLALALLPLALEKLMHCRICLPVYLFALIYSLGPMLGNCWKLYYTLPGWDKLLHISGGVMFAIIGGFLLEQMTRGENRPAVTAVFALCFSVAIAAVWEFTEFASDALFGMDMQNDTVVHSLTSYLLGDGVGVTGSLENISSVAVNGVTLPVDGYIDIGLIDTMLDMLLETAGALVACVCMGLDRGRHPLIKKVPKMPENEGGTGETI